MKKIVFLLFVLIGTISQAQVNVVGYIQTNGVANYPTHIDSMGKGGYMSIQDSFKRNNIPCLRRKYGMAVYVHDLQKLYILKDSSCNNIWEEFSAGGGGGGGGATPSSAFGSFYDSTIQTITSTTIAYPIKITKIDTAIGFRLQNNKIIADSVGIYNLQWSGQFQNTDNVEQDINVWIRKNGIDVVGSLGKISVPKSHGSGTPGHTISSWNYIIPMNINDSIVFYWQASNTSVTLQYYAQQTSPTRPSTASIIATITPVIAGGGTGGGGGGGTQDLKSVLSFGHDLLDGQNYQGTGSGDGNTGINVNSFGTLAAKSNSGNNVNAFGENAGLNNTFDNVNLFGKNTIADNPNQTIFSKDTILNERIDYNCISDNRKHILPDYNGFFMVSDYTEIDAGSVSSYTIQNGGVYNCINTKSSYPLAITLPDPSSNCSVKGQRIVITNISLATDASAVDLFTPSGKIQYRGSQIDIDKVGIGETIELYSDGIDWRTISSLPEPRMRLNMGTGNYDINSNGTYFIDVASLSYKIHFPNPAAMPGSKITIINKDNTNAQDYETIDNTNPISICGDNISNIGTCRAQQFVSDGENWIIMSSY